MTAVKQYTVNAARDVPEALLSDIAALEHRAHAMGFTLVGHSLNRAKNVLGWTMAANMDAAAKAMDGK